MRLLPLMLLVVCCSASAEWTLIGESSRAQIYIDFETTEKKQGTIFIWQLTNVFDEAPYKSLATKMEYDCKQKRSRAHQEARYSEHFMSGQTISNQAYSDEWLFAAPGTISMKIINTLCKK